MKKIKLTKKLTLKKQTVSRLNRKQMDSVRGGSNNSDDLCCDTKNCDTSMYGQTCSVHIGCIEQQ